MLEVLQASGPAPEVADATGLFGQFFGVWGFDSIAYRADGSQQRASGEWHFGWVLEGRAIQDVWIFPRRADRGARPAGFDGAGEYGEYGSTLRFYDAALDRWRVVWVGPVYGNLRTFTAQQIGDEIVLDGATPAGQPLRWRFSDITRDAFHWRAETFDGEVERWRLTEELFVRRRSG